MRIGGPGRTRRAREAKWGVYRSSRRPAAAAARLEERLRADAAAWEYWTARPPSYRRTAIDG